MAAPFSRLAALRLGAGGLVPLQPAWPRPAPLPVCEHRVVVEGAVVELGVVRGGVAVDPAAWFVAAILREVRVPELDAQSFAVPALLVQVLDDAAAEAQGCWTCTCERGLR